MVRENSGCGQGVEFGCGPAPGLQLLCQLAVAGGIPGSGRADSGRRVCHRELPVALVTSVHQLPLLQVFFAVLLVGVSVGQALPHLQILVSANAAGKRLQDIVQRVRYQRVKHTHL